MKPALTEGQGSDAQVPLTDITLQSREALPSRRSGSSREGGPSLKGLAYFSAFLGGCPRYVQTRRNPGVL